MTDSPIIFPTDVGREDDRVVEDQKIGMRSFVEHGPGKAKFVGK